MKSKYSLLLCCLFMITTALCQSGDSWLKTKASKSGTLLCLWNEAYGIVYKNDQGKLSGVCVELLEEFRVYLKKNYNADVAIEFVEEKSFAKFLQRVEKSNVILGVSTVSVTEDRKRTFLFSPYFISNPNVLVSHKDAPKLTDLKDLPAVFKGYKMKVIAGSTHKAIAHSLKSKFVPNLVIEEAMTSRDIFTEMKTNKNLFTIIDFGEFLGAYKNKFPIARQSVDLGVDDKLAFLMGKNNDWEPLWREFLTDDYRKSARYRKIIADNLGMAYLGMIQ